MKCIYFADLMGDIQQEKRQILRELKHDYGIELEITATDRPPFERKFDVLFFDWGGMSMGNSMLHSFCEEIVKHAENHPSSLYIMTSSFTEEAMKDMIDDLPKEGKPANVFLCIKDAVPLLKAWNKK